MHTRNHFGIVQNGLLSWLDVGLCQIRGCLESVIGTNTTRFGDEKGI